MPAFPGWTLPGVMGAGAAQTMMNLNRVRPGRRILMLGSGNVGLVVGFQLLQAGCDVVAVADAAPRVGGYGVHAAKLSRCGVPFFLSHTIVAATGTDRVAGVVLGEVDAQWRVIPGTEKFFEADTVCIAVGLSGSAELLKMAGCEMTDRGPLGYLPVRDRLGETGLRGLYACGDAAGVDEASAAMIEGRISGAAAANSLGFLADSDLDTRLAELERAIGRLHDGMFAPGNRGTIPKKTNEGCDVSASLLTRGYLSDDELFKYPGVGASVPGIRPVIECTQNIPCDPCRDACPKNCIGMDENIVSLPRVDGTAACIGCGLCVASCPGQAIFLVDGDIGGGFASVTLPYEFLPVPEIGETGICLGRDGKPVCEGRITDYKNLPAFDKTGLLTMAVPKKYHMAVRFWKRRDEDGNPSKTPV
jgi:ferredoxin